MIITVVIMISIIIIIAIIYHHHHSQCLANYSWWLCQHFKVCFKQNCFPSLKTCFPFCVTLTHNNLTFLRSSRTSNLEQISHATLPDVQPNIRWLSVASIRHCCVSHAPLPLKVLSVPEWITIVLPCALSPLTELPFVVSDIWVTWG